MKKLYLFSILALAPLAQTAQADEIAMEKTPANSWLEARGTMSATEVGAALNVELSPAQRAQLEKAVAQRNAALEKINAQFSAQLQTILGADDQKLAEKAVEKTEAEKAALQLERMRAYQPRRYEALMRAKRAEEKNNQK